MIADCITRSDPDPLYMFQRKKLSTSIIMTRIILLSLVVQAPAIKGNHIKTTELYFGERDFEL